MCAPEDEEGASETSTCWATQSMKHNIYCNLQCTGLGGGYDTFIHPFDACELCIEKCAFTMNHVKQVASKRVAVSDEVMIDGK